MMASKRILGVLAVMILGAGASGWAQPRECYNSPILFSNDSFQGRQLPLRDSVPDLHAQGMGDDASSVCVPSGWRVILYEDSNYGGSSLELRGPITVADLKRDRPQGQNWGDRVSAVRVYQPRRRLGSYSGRLPRDCGQYPVLFKNDSFRGGAARLDRSVSDLHRSGMGDDASSVCVPEGWRVVLYEDTDFRGDRLEVYGPDAIQDLKRDRPGGRSWGDRISSAEVERVGGDYRRPSESGGINKNDYPRGSEIQCRYPTLFGSRDYRGRRLELNDSVTDLRRRGFGDTVESICVPDGYRVVLFEQPGYRGRSMEVSGRREIADLERSGQSSGYGGHHFASARVERSSSGFFNDNRPRPDYGSSGPCRDYPVLYSDDGFRGASLQLTRSIRNLDSEGFGDAASSVCVPAGWVIVLYADADFRGDYLEVSSGQSISDLRRDRPGGRDWGDQVSSVEVRRHYR